MEFAAAAGGAEEQDSGNAEDELDPDQPCEHPFVWGRSHPLMVLKEVGNRAWYVADVVQQGVDFLVVDYPGKHLPFMPGARMCTLQQLLCFIGTHQVHCPQQHQPSVLELAACLCQLAA